MYRLARGQFQDSSPPLKHELEAVGTKAGDEPGDEARSVSSLHRLITQTLGLAVTSRCKHSLDILASTNCTAQRCGFCTA